MPLRRGEVLTLFSFNRRSHRRRYSGTFDSFLLAGGAVVDSHFSSLFVRQRIYLHSELLLLRRAASSGPDISTSDERSEIHRTERHTRSAACVFIRALRH